MAGNDEQVANATATGERDFRAELERLYLLLDQEADEVTGAGLRADMQIYGECLETYDVEVLVKSLVSRSCRERAPEPLRQRVLYSIRTVHIEGHTEGHIEGQTQGRFDG